MRSFTGSPIVSTLLVTFGLATSAQAAPAMFQASFIIHAWGNDISSRAAHWSAMPLGYDCYHASPTTVSDPRYCSPAKRQRGHPATGYGDGTTTSRLIIGTGTPPAILLQQSAIGVTGVTGYRPATIAWTRSKSYASFVNDAGSFFAGGGPAVYGTVTKTSMYPCTVMGACQRTGTWRIYPGKNAFGGTMGLLGQIRTHVSFPLVGYIKGKLPIIPAIGHPLFNTIISYGTMGTTYFQNPFATRFKELISWGTGWSRTSYDVLGSGTLWTTGRVQIRFQQSHTPMSHTYPTASVSRTGYDNRTAGGLGRIQLVTPTLVHRSFRPPRHERHTAQIGVLTIQVPEPGGVALLITGLATLCGLYHLSRR
jgi:hypothetical protein